MALGVFGIRQGDGSKPGGSHGPWRPVLPVPPFRQFRVGRVGVRAIDGAAEDVQDAAVDRLASQLAEIVEHLLGVPADQVRWLTDTEIDQVAGHARSDAGEGLELSRHLIHHRATETTETELSSVPRLLGNQ